MLIKYMLQNIRLNYRYFSKSVKSYQNVEIKIKNKNHKKIETLDNLSKKKKKKSQWGNMTINME